MKILIVAAIVVIIVCGLFVYDVIHCFGLSEKSTLSSLILQDASKVTIDDCLNAYEEYGSRVVINDGKIIDCIEEE